MKTFEYTLYCESCAQSYTANFPEDTTVVCPKDASHTLRESSVSVVREITPSNEIEKDFKGRIRTVNTSRTDPYTWSYFTSAGDSLTLGIGEGNDFSAQVTTEDSCDKSISFLEDVEVHYGIATFNGMALTDRVSVWVHAPATPTKAWESGTKLGKVEIKSGSGLYMIVEDPLGTFQFDETNGQHPIPVESYDNEWNPTGHWDRVLNPTDYSSATYTFNAGGTGQFDFFTFPIDLGWFVNNCRMVGDSSLVVFNNEDAFRCYKGWNIKLSLENGNKTRTTPASVAVILKLNRKTIR